MSEDVCLSIIVPIYNVEKYLGKCLDSLLRTGNIESTQIILVDDGSTDRSGVIADDYSEKYGFIECFHKQNGGLSDARNFGLNKATGRYVFFCDSDDMVAPDGLSVIIETSASTTVDVILWDGIAIDENDIVINSEINNILSHSGLSNAGSLFTGVETMVRQIEDHNRIAVPVWLRACRRSFLIDNELFFKEGLIHEDELWTPRVMMLSYKVLYIPDIVYRYRVRKNSIMNSDNNQEKHAQAMIGIMNELYGLYSQKTDDRKIYRVLISAWADKYLWLIGFYEAYKYGDSMKIPRFKIFNSCNSIKSRLKSTLLLFLGVRLYCYFFRIHNESKRLSL